MKETKQLLEKRWFFYGCAFLIPAFSMLFICMVMGITPFGKESFLIADMQKQYVDYLSYYKSILSGEQNILYTFGKCLGGDMIGFFTYYLMSPLNVIFVFLKDTWIPAGITILIVCKMGLCGSTMAYYLKNRFGTKNRAEIFIFSTSYALMGYLCVNSFNIMWLDALVLFPCVLYGIEEILDEKKPFIYLWALFGVLFTNYYIGYMICIASVLYFLYRLLVIGKGKGLFKKLWRFAYASLLAAGLCAVVLIPTFLTLQGSLKDGQDLGAGITLPNLRPARVLSKVFTMAYSENELMNGMPNIFCGICILVLVILFFFNSKIRLRERILSGCLLGVIMGSFCIAGIDFVWHAFMEPSGYHYRYSFLFSFFMIVFAYQGFIKREEGLSRKRFAYGAVAFLFLFCVVFRHPYEYISVKKALPDVLLFFLMLGVFYLIWQGKNYRMLMLLLAVLQLGNLVLNGTYVYMKNRNTSYCNAKEYAEAVGKIRPVTEEIKKMDTGVYRMENLEKRNNNDAMHFSYAGLTHYSSNEKNFVLFFLERMGFNYNRLYAEYGNGSTQTVDSLLGVKYLIGSDASINKNYTAKLEIDGLKVYENPYALPLGFLAETGVRETDWTEENPFALQNKMYKMAAGNNTSVLEPATVKNVQTENCTQTTEDNLTVYKGITEENPVSVTYELETVADGRVYAYMTAGDFLQNAEVYVNKEYLCGYLNRSNWKILNLGEYKKGEKISFTIQTTEETLRLENAYFVTENEENLKAQYDTIMESPVTITRLSSSKLQASVDTQKEKILVFSIPFEEDWNVYVDGKKVETEKVYQTFLAVSISPGQHNVTLSYVPKGLYVGSVVSLLCAGILLVLFWKERSTKNKEKNNGNKSIL